MPLPDKLMIGTEAGGVLGMVTVESFNLKSRSFDVTPVHFSRYIRLGNGKTMGQGWRQCEWHMNGIRNAPWDVFFDTYRTDQSTPVYIRTYSEDGKTFANYYALMHWQEAPVTRDHDTNVVLDFTLTFTQLIVQAEVP